MRRQGASSKAVEMARKAETLAASAGNQGFAERNEKMAQLFLARQPFPHNTRISELHPARAETIEPAFPCFDFHAPKFSGSISSHAGQQVQFSNRLVHLPAPGPSHPRSLFPRHAL